MSGETGASGETECERRTATLETKLTSELAQLNASRELTHRVMSDEAHDALPVVASGNATFDAGLFTDVAEGDADPEESFHNIVARATCEAPAGPLRVYLAGGDDKSRGERAAWLAAASQLWKRPLEARGFVRLATSEPVFPWPAHSEVGQQLAKAVFAVTYRPDVDTLAARVREVNQGCDQIGQLASAIPRTFNDTVLALPRGLRACGCKVANLDETIAVNYVTFYTTSDVRWQPVEPTYNPELVHRLDCEDAKRVRVLRQIDHWRDHPRPDSTDEIRKVTVTSLTECLTAKPLAKPRTIQVRLEGQDYDVIAELDDNVDDADDLRRCFGSIARQSPVNLGTSSDDKTILDVALPAGIPSPPK